jgi:Spy/CpxP family protein refolding chaperone
MMGRRQWGPLGRDLAFDPAHLLARKDVLALTPQQVTRLAALRQSAEPAFTASRTEIRKQREAIAAIMKADAPDTMQLKQQLMALQTAANSAHWARISASIQARAVLNESQRGRVQRWLDVRRMGHPVGQRYHL